MKSLTLYLHNKPENQLETRTEICICKDLILHQKVAWPNWLVVIIRCLYFINNKDNFNVIILFPLNALKALLWPVMTALRKIWSIVLTNLDLKEEFVQKWHDYVIKVTLVCRSPNKVQTYSKCSEIEKTTLNYEIKK